MLRLPQMVCVAAMMMLVVKAAELPTTLFWPTDLFLSAQSDSMVNTDVKKDLGVSETAEMATPLDPLISTQRTVETRHGTSYINKVTDTKLLQNMSKMVTGTEGGVHTTPTDISKEEMTTTDTDTSTTPSQNSADTSTTLECSTDPTPVPKHSEEILTLPFVFDKFKFTEISGQHAIAPVTKTDQNISKTLVNLLAILEQSHLNVAHNAGVQSSDPHIVSSAPDSLVSTLPQVSSESSHEDPLLGLAKMHYMIIWNREAMRLNAPFLKVTNIWPQVGMVHMPIITQLSEQIQNSEPVKKAAQKFKAVWEKTHTAKNSPNSVNKPVLKIHNFLSAWAWAIGAGNKVHATSKQAYSDLNRNDSILNTRFNPTSMPMEAKTTSVLKDNPVVRWDIHENQNSSPTTTDAQRAQDLKPFGIIRSLRSAIPSTAVRRPARTIPMWPADITTSVPLIAGIESHSPTIANQNPDTSNHRPVSTSDVLTNTEKIPIAAHRPVESPTVDQAPTDHPNASPCPSASPIAFPKPIENPIAVQKPITNPTAVPRPIANPIAVPRPIANPIAVPRPIANPIAVPRPITNPIAVPRPIAAVPRPSAISMPVPRPVTNIFTFQTINGNQRIVYNSSIGFNSQSHESKEDNIYSYDSKEDEIDSNESKEGSLIPLPLSLLYNM